MVTSALDAARCHKRVLVNETRCGQAGDKRYGAQRSDKEFFDQRISLAVVTISDEEGEIDILARSGILPEDVCPSRLEQPWEFANSMKAARRDPDFFRCLTILNLDGEQQKETLSFFFHLKIFWSDTAQVFATSALLAWRSGSWRLFLWNPACVFTSWQSTARVASFPEVCATGRWPRRSAELNHMSDIHAVECFLCACRLLCALVFVVLFFFSVKRLLVFFLCLWQCVFLSLNCHVFA